METMVLQTLCAAAMALVGALIARGWPGGGPKSGTGAAQEEERPDAFADDLTAMLAYTGEKEDKDGTV